MKKVSIAELLELSASERIQLAEDLWDSIIEVPDSVIVTDTQREELDRRLEAYRKNPQAGLPWEEIKAKLHRSA